MWTQQSIRGTWDKRHSLTMRCNKIISRRRAMTRQTISYWRWWGMTIATRNDERQGQRVMWRMHAMWDKDEDNEGDATINNQYNDNDKRRLQRGRGKWTSADKEDDKGGRGGHERNTKLRTARENTGYATIITGMTTRQESNEETGHWGWITPLFYY